MDGCDIYSNTSAGVYCEEAEVHIINSAITDNDSSGIRLVNSISAVVDSSTISGNSAQHGGGIYCINSSPTVSHCDISGNTAANNGGGIYCNDSSPIISYCTISDNSAYRGGGLYSIDSSPSIVHCTINGNSSSDNGGGMVIWLSNPDIVNTIFSNHSGLSCIYFDSSPNTSITYCDFYNNEHGNFAGSTFPSLGQLAMVNFNGDSCDIYSNIYFDPLFYSTTGDSAFLLTEDSPCIDAGDPASAHDPDGTIADIGAFYFQQQAIWQLMLTCTGEEGTAPNQFFLNIGGDEESSFTPAPPPPPQYMCWTQLWDSTTTPWAGPYSGMIYEWADTNEYVWALEVDPNGNMTPPVSRTSVFTWDADDLPIVPPDYGFWIEDANGMVVIPDMSLQDSLQVTGASTVFYYIRYGHAFIWQMTLTCVGEAGAAPNLFELTIGGGDQMMNIPAPPPPPEYMCWTQMWDTTATPWGGPYNFMVCQWADTSEYLWTIEIDPNGNVVPPISRTSVITWNPEDLPTPPADYGFYIVDNIGSVVVLDMMQEDSLEVTGSSNVFYYLKYGKTMVHYEFNLSQYWSLISLPVIPANFELSYLFPNATVAYAFENATYVQATELENRKAYWLYVPEAEVDTVWGMPFNYYSISVNPPWEMLGGVYQPAVPLVTPGEIVVMYRFDQTYYTVPSFTMEPGSGYWVNFTEDATTFSLGGDYMLAGLDEGGLVSEKNKTGKSVSSESGNWELALNISGEAISAANNFVLTIGRGESSSFLPAPPAPPDYSVWCELYEEEWASGPYFTMIQPLDSTNETVWLLSIDPNGNITPPEMRTAVVEWDTLSLPGGGVCYIEDCSSGEIIVEDMRAGDSFEIEGSETRHFKIIQIPGLEVGSPNENFPDHYVLEQNRPNPFNPSTNIRYYLRDAGKVKLTVYNIMGEEVAVLVDNTQSAGYHTVNFEGSNLPSGIYFYRLKAGDFSDIKKMIIVK